MSDPAERTPGKVLRCLADDDCRAILRVTHGPRTAPEISDRCDIPMSTVYRKVDRLTDLSLLETRLRIDSSGRHPTQYEREVDGLLVQFGPREEFSVSVYRTAGRAGDPVGTERGVGDVDDDGGRGDGRSGEPFPVEVEFVGEDAAVPGGQPTDAESN